MADKHSRLREKCGQACGREGWGWIPYPSNYMTGPGVSDGIAFPEGLFVAVECKTEEYPEQTPKQKTFQKYVESRGGKYFLVFSSEEMVRKIKEYLNCG
jgi:hypothetical protein